MLGFIQTDYRILLIHIVSPRSFFTFFSVPYSNFDIYYFETVEPVRFAASDFFKITFDLSIPRLFK